jgi:hypothetical protein
MTAPGMGIGTDEAVHSIEMVPGGLPTTWGRMLSADLEAIDATASSPEALRTLFTKAKAQGVDVERWPLLKSFQDMMGPAAEAKFLGKPFRIVWFGTSAGDDRNYVVRNCGLAGINSDDAVTVRQPQVEAALARPEVWALVMDIAKAIDPKRGGLGGAEVAAIARRHLPDPPANIMPGEAAA